RLGHGIRQVIANYNHPARTAEAIGMLDLVSNGRAELGIGEGATRLELGGFNIPAQEKRAMSLEAAGEVANMMVMTTYPGVPGRSRLWEEFQEQRKSGALAATYEGTQGLASAFQASPGIGTPADFRKHVQAYEAAGVDQIILLQQAGRNSHADICASLELFASEVLPEFKAKAEAREHRKAEELAPYIEKALTRKK